jgi:hypothetical protein
MDTNPYISDSLHRSEIFKGLTSEQFASLLKRGRRIKLQPKSVLFHQGVPSENAFKALDVLAAAIAQKHKEHGFT